MTELKIKKERVLEAAKDCPTAKSVLEKIFPEVFEEPPYKDFDVIIHTPTDTLRFYYKRTFYGLKLTKQHWLDSSLNLRIVKKEDYKSKGNISLGNDQVNIRDRIIAALKNEIENELI